MTTSISDKPLYNSRILDTYLKLIKNRYSYINISELLAYAGIESYQVADEACWFDQGQINRFHDRLQALTGNVDIAREAGAYAASPDAIGVMRPYILGLIGPARVYELIGRATVNFTRSSTYQTKKIFNNKIEITVTLNEGVKEEPFQCNSRLGYIDAVATIFNYDLPKVEHTECIFKGGSCCRYIVSWSKSQTDLWKRIRSYFIITGASVAIASTVLAPELLPVEILYFILPATIVLSFVVGAYEKKELNAAIDNLRESTEHLLNENNTNYSNVLMINEIGMAVSKQLEIDEVLQEIVKILEKRLDYDRGLVLLANDEKNKLIYRAGFGYTADESSLLSKAEFHIDREDSKGVFVVSYREKKPILVNDLDEIIGTLSSRSLEFARKMNVKSFICCPIMYEDEVIGILAVDNVKKKRTLKQSDMNLLMGIVPEIGVSIHNARLIESEMRQFKSVIQVLAASIDARDPLTSGHSEKVAEYAIGISRELLMTTDFIDMIEIAAVLHDYGKIGIDDSILKKPGRLTDDEFRRIQTHADTTNKILSKMDFRGIYSSIPEIAWSHHEKVDGSGYPRGLKDGEIHIGAKIIAVADFFEAITSHRHYRGPMPDEAAISILMNKSGKLFDETTVKAFLNYYTKKSENKVILSYL